MLFRLFCPWAIFFMDGTQLLKSNLLVIFVMIVLQLASNYPGTIIQPSNHPLNQYKGNPDVWYWEAMPEPTMGGNSRSLLYQMYIFPISVSISKSYHTNVTPLIHKHSYYSTIFVGLPLLKCTPLKLIAHNSMDQQIYNPIADPNNFILPDEQEIESIASTLLKDPQFPTIMVGFKEKVITLQGVQQQVQQFSIQQQLKFAIMSCINLRDLMKVHNNNLATINEEF